MKGLLLVVSVCLLWTATAALDNTTQPIPRILLRNISTTFVPDSHAHFTCEAPGLPKYAGYKFWEKGSVVSDTGSNEFFIGFLEPSDSGTYWCSIPTQDGGWVRSSNNISIRVEKPATSTHLTPHIVVHNVSTMALYSRGDEAHLSCEGPYINSSDRVELRVDGVVLSEIGGNKDFYLKHLQVSDTGNYTCEVLLTGGARMKSKNSVFLQVWENTMDVSTAIPPTATPHIVLKNDVTDFVEGDTAHVTCAGLSIGSVDRVELSFNGVVHSVNLGSKDFYLDYLRESDTGTYTCAVLYFGSTRRDSHNSVYIKVSKDSSVLSTIQPTTVASPYIALKGNVTEFNVGDTAHVTCGGISIGPNDKVELRVNGTLHSGFWGSNEFYLKDLHESDTGTYACSVLYSGHTRRNSYNTVYVKVFDHSKSTVAPWQSQPPRIALHNISTSFVPDSHALFTCDGNGRVPEDQVYTFWKGDVAISEKRDKEYFVSFLKPSDSGKYWCSIPMKDGAKVKSSNYITINVENVADSTLDTPYIVLHNYSSMALFYTGEAAHLSCEVPYLDPGDLVELKVNGKVFVTNIGYKNFYVYNLQVYDTGDYTCDVLASGIDRKNSNNSVFIQVWENYSQMITTAKPPNATPHILVKNNVTDFRVGETAQMICAGIPIGPKDRVQLSNYGVEISTNTGSNVFNMNYLKKADTGHYTCAVMLSWEGSWSYSNNSVYINVRDSWQVSTIQPTTAASPYIALKGNVTEFNVGDTAHVTCGGISIGPNDKVELRVNGTLHSGFWGSNEFYLKDLHESDTGTYACSVLYSGHTRRDSYNTVFVKVFGHSMNTTAKPPNATPHILVKNNVTEFRVGDTAQMICAGIPIGPKDRVQLMSYKVPISTNTGSNVFNMNYLKEGDTGHYTCAVMLSWESSWRHSNNSVYINVRDSWQVTTTVRPETLPVPKILLHNITTNFFPGSLVQFSCQLLGVLVPEDMMYTFWKGDSPISEKRNNHHDVSSLKPSDSGTYWCSIPMKDGGKMKSSNNIAINVQNFANPTPDTPHIVLHNYSSMALFYTGGTAHLSCEVPYLDSGDLVEWRVNGVVYTTNAFGYKDFYLKNLQVSDTGDYTCAVLDSGITRKTSNNSVFIQVWKSYKENSIVPVPKILLHNISTTFVPGSLANFSCEAPNVPEDELYTFWKGDFPITEKRLNYHVIRDIKSSDSGKYWCSIPNRESGEIKSSNNINISVKNATNSTMYTPHIIVLNARPVALFKKGDDAYVKCEGTLSHDDARVALTVNGVVWQVKLWVKSFTIKNLNESDTGNYECVFDYYGIPAKSNNSVFIQVWDSMPKRIDYRLPKVQVDNAEPDLGDTVYLTCLVDRPLLGASFQFWKEGDIVGTSLYNKYQKNNVNLSDSGTYWCALITSHGKHISSWNGVSVDVINDPDYYYTTTMTSVTIHPTIRLHETFSFVYEGADAHFSCDAPGYGPYDEYVLRKQGDKLVQQIGQEFFLYNLKTKDTGQYSCEVLLTNGMSLMSSNNVYLDVRSRPYVVTTTVRPETDPMPKILLHNITTSFLPGSLVHFSCEVSGVSEDEVYTFWKGDSLISEKRHNHHYIPELKFNDSGKYWCSIPHKTWVRTKSSNVINITVQNATTSTKYTPHIVVANVNSMALFKRGVGIYLTCEGQPIAPNYQVEFTVNGVVRYTNQRDISFHINNATESDTGNYSCTVISEGRRMDSNNSVFIQVWDSIPKNSIGPVPKILLHNISTSFVPGSLANFSCVAPSVPEDELYTFWKGDFPITEKRLNYHVIRDIKSSDSGKYWCSIPHREFGKIKSSNNINISVKNATNSTMYTPHIIVLNAWPVALFKKGDDAHVFCEGTLSHDDARVALTVNGVVWQVGWVKSFTIKNLNESDTGNYECVFDYDGTPVKSNNSVFIQVWDSMPKRIDYRRPKVQVDNAEPDLGDTVYLTCLVDRPLLGASFQFWNYDGIVGTSLYNKYQKNNVNLSDSGMYWCALITSHGEHIISWNGVRVDVKNDPDYYYTTTMTSVTIHPTIRLHETFSFVYEGADAHFSCDAPGYGPYDEYVLSKQGDKLVQQIGQEFFLYNLKTKDTGQYSCEVLLTNGMSLMSSNNVYLDVRSRPYVANTTSRPSNLPWIRLENKTSNLTQGDTARLSCQLDSKPYSDTYYQFWKEDVIVASTYNNAFDIHNLQLTDSGLYWCSLLTREGKIRSSNSVIINVRKDANPYHSNTTTPGYHTNLPTIVLHKPMSYLYEGAGAHFSCEAPGYGPNDQYELSSHGRVVTQQTGKDFFLYNLRVSDSGEYACALLSVYKKIGSHNTVYIEVRPIPGPWDGDGEYPSASQMSARPYPFLIASLILVLMGISVTKLI